MYAEERQQAIATQVLAVGRASVADLAQTYAVTTETVRRDLHLLDKAGVVRRVHGGAVPARSLQLAEQGVRQRGMTRTKQKAAIAAAAADYLPAAGSSVLFDAGTTTMRVAELVPTDVELVVVTNSIPVANKLTGNPAVTLQLLGGRVRGLTQAVVGEPALQALQALRIDVAFIGANGVSIRHGLSTPDSDEAAIKRAMIESANYVVVTTDSTKIGQEDLVSFAPLCAVDVLITDQDITERARAALVEAGVEVICVQEMS